MVKDVVFGRTLYEFMRENHPITYKRWIKDLYSEKDGRLHTQKGFTPDKALILEQFEQGLSHCSSTDCREVSNHIVAKI